MSRRHAINTLVCFSSDSANLTIYRLCWICIYIHTYNCDLKSQLCYLSPLFRSKFQSRNQIDMCACAFESLASATRGMYVHVAIRHKGNELRENNRAYILSPRVKTCRTAECFSGSVYEPACPCLRSPSLVYSPVRRRSRARRIQSAHKRRDRPWLIPIPPLSLPG